MKTFLTIIALALALITVVKAQERAITGDAKERAQAIIEAVVGQRNNAQNQVAQLAAELALAQNRVRELEKTCAPKPDKKPEPAKEK